MLSDRRTADTELTAYACAGAGAFAGPGGGPRRTIDEVIVGF